MLFRSLDTDQQRVLDEVALLAAACRISDPRKLALLRRMVRTKPRDLCAYQRLLLGWLGASKVPARAKAGSSPR